MCGTLGYVSPEVLLEEGYNHEVDMFSLGVVLFFLVTGQLPFDDNSDQRIIDMTVVNDIPIKSSTFSKLNEDLPDLLKAMMNKDPKKRISYEK